jgi:hypothetical protein
MKPLIAAALAAVIMSAGQGALGQATTPAPPPTNVPPTGVAPAEKNAQMALEKAGYTQVKDLKSTPRGVSAKAMKDGKEVSVVVDTNGKIEQE